MYVARGHETEVRAYDGEVESLSSATSAGVGIRVVLSGDPGRGTGSASPGPGRSNPPIIDATLAEARDNARFATAGPRRGAGRPDGVSPATLDLWDDRAGGGADGRQGGAGPRPRAPGTRRRPPDPAGRLGRLRGRCRRGGPGVDHGHHGRRRGERPPTCRSSAIAGEGTDSQTGRGFSVGRAPADGSIPTAAAADAVAAGGPDARGRQRPRRAGLHGGVRPARRVHAAVGRVARRCRARPW